MLGTCPLNTGACVDQPITGLPHTHALCMTQHVVRIVYMRPGGPAALRPLLTAASTICAARPVTPLPDKYALAAGKRTKN